jgi:TadE-like protein
MRSRGPAAGRTRLLTVTAVRRRGQRGAVTAEAAVVIPLLLAVAMALVWLVALAATQVRVVDAAREAARAAARGETDVAAVGLGRQVAPEGARFEVSRGGGAVTVRVVADVRGPGGLLAFLPSVPVRSEAVAAEEPASAVGVG